LTLTFDFDSVVDEAQTLKECFSSLKEGGHRTNRTGTDYSAPVMRRLEKVRSSKVNHIEWARRWEW